MTETVDQADSAGEFTREQELAALRDMLLVPLR